MALRCETCGADNPATNRYCGQCGSSLEQTAPNPSEEPWQDATAESVEPREASADLPPEIIDFDNRIPLFATEGQDRRVHPPPEMVEQVHDHLEREAELHDELQHGSEPHYEVLANQEAEHDEFLRWKINNFDEKAFFDNVATDEATDDAAPPPPLDDFLPGGESAARTGVTGPSFLGLSDDPIPEDDYEEPEPKSHLWRNVALAVLAAAAVLAAVQWRSIRDYGLAYVQSGSKDGKQLTNGATQNAPAVATVNPGRDLGPDQATSKAGSPQAVESRPNAGTAPDAQQATTAQQPAQPSPAPPATNTQRTPAIRAPAPDVARHVRRESPRSASRSAAKPRQFRAPPPARSVSRTAPGPGAVEMNRAVSASDAEARAAWLWRAVAKGNPQAPVELAKMYEQGNGVVRSCDQAKVLLRAAAAKGNAQARLSLQQIRIRGGCSAR